MGVGRTSNWVDGRLAHELAASACSHTTRFAVSGLSGGYPSLRENVFRAPEGAPARSPGASSKWSGCFLPPPVARSP